MDSFAQRLTLLRENRSLKKKELASILNVSSACISQYENGDTMPSPELLIQIAQYFGVTVDFLLAIDITQTALDLRETFCQQLSYYDLLNACSKLSPKARCALLTVIDALQDHSPNE